MRALDLKHTTETNQCKSMQKKKKEIRVKRRWQRGWAWCSLLRHGERGGNLKLFAPLAVNIRSTRRLRSFYRKHQSDTANEMSNSGPNSSPHLVQDSSFAFQQLFLVFVLYFLDMHFKIILKRYFDATTCNVSLSIWKCGALKQHSANGLETTPGASSTHCHLSHDGFRVYCKDGEDDIGRLLHALHGCRV